MAFYKKITKTEINIAFYGYWILGVLIILNLLLQTFANATPNPFLILGELLGGGLIIYLIIYIPLSVLHAYKSKFK